MNPFLEQPDSWHSFHESFCPAILEAIVPQIRPKYIAKIDEFVYLHELSAEERRLVGRGDVTVSQRNDRDSSVLVAPTVAASVFGSVRLAVDEERLSFIRVLDRETREVVTVIELLSPSNKDSGEDRSQYLGKRERVLESPAHLVELDLLRGGRRPPIDDQPECDYCVMVSRAEMRPRVELWPFSLRDPLPRIPVPLRSPDPDAVLDLQAILNRVYDAAGYEDYIYSGTPKPPLSPNDQQWAMELLTAAGRTERPSELSDR
jgi:hypothetical protein